MNSGRVNIYLLRSTIVAALGGLLFGFDTAVISGATSALAAQYSLTPYMLGLTVSAALWGTVIGSLFAGPPSDRYGRRGALEALAILYVVTALGCALAWNWYAFLLFRFIGGLAIGGSSVIGPMYIAEVAPADKRGRLVGFFQLNIVAGILVAYLSNYLIGLANLGAAEWRWKLGVTGLPAALFFLMLLTIPQSPRWLVRRGSLAEAKSVFTKIGEPDPEQEIKDVLESLGTESREKSEPLFQARYRLPIFLAIAIGFFNQMSGINAILYYLNDIFAAAGFSKVSSDLQAVGIGFTNLVFTIIAMSVIDKLGRKKLLLTGAVGTAACLAGVAVIFASGSHEEMLVWLLIGFIAFFAFSQGAVIWVYLSEVFPNLVRAKGQSLGSFTHWIMNAIISAVFPALAARSKPAPFVFFALMTAVQFFVILMFFPETKGFTLEEMQHKLTRALTIVFLACVFAGSVRAQVAQIPTQIPIAGPALYKDWCAVCHGTTGSGHGPMAAYLKTPPSDLTRLAARNGGKYPIARVQRLISGDEELASGHGTAAMPIWGPVFSRIEKDQDWGRVRIYNVAKYIEGLQK